MERYIYLSEMNVSLHRNETSLYRVPWHRPAVGISLTPIILLGIIGNVFSLLVWIKGRRRKTSTATFLSALAVADILVLSTPATEFWLSAVLHIEFRQTNSALCRIFYFLSYLEPSLSSWILVAVTMERAMSVWIPHKINVVCRPLTAVATIVIITFCLFALYLPVLVGVDVVTKFTTEVMWKECTALSTSAYNKYLLEWLYLDLCLFFLVPFVTIFVCNILILGKVVTGLIGWDTECGVTKGCFPDCVDGCEYLVTWKQAGLTIEFSLQAEETDTDVYLAIGFSEDYRMGDDSVVGCIIPSSEVISAFNDGIHTEILYPRNLGLSSAIPEVSMNNGVITCNFTRDVTNTNEKFFDLNDDYILMLVVGETEGTSLGKHYMIPWSSDSKVDFNSFDIIDLYKLNSPLVKFHGIMAVFAWLLLSVIGILTARYNKDMLRNKTMFGSKIWFQVHRASMIAVLICLLMSIMPIFIEIRGYSQIVPSKQKNYLQLHPIIGILVTTLTVANLIAGFLRPNTGHRYRWLYNWAHMLNGILTQIFAVFAILVGYNLERSKLPVSTIYITVAMIVMVALACIILEVDKWKNNKKRGRSVYSGSTKQESSPQSMVVKDKSTGNRQSATPFYFLCAVALIICGLTIAVMGIIAAS